MSATFTCKSAQRMQSAQVWISTFVIILVINECIATIDSSINHLDFWLSLCRQSGRAAFQGRYQVRMQSQIHCQRYSCAHAGHQITSRTDYNCRWNAAAFHCVSSGELVGCSSKKKCSDLVALICLPSAGVIDGLPETTLEPCLSQSKEDARLHLQSISKHLCACLHLSTGHTQ